MVRVEGEMEQVAEFDVSTDKTQSVGLCIREDLGVFGATEPDIAYVERLNACMA